MRRITFITTFLILILLLTLFILLNNIFKLSAKTTGKIHEIILTEDGFSPSEITIKSGDAVKFTSQLNEPFWPASDLHPTHGIYPEFDPQEPIDSGKSWTFQFLKSGRWKYHDHLMPYYRGAIIVK